MKLGLFIPCYVDQLHPAVGQASLGVLEKLGQQVEVLTGPACCGQPMSNSGYAHLAQESSRQFIEHASGFDAVLCPSGSCTLHLRESLEPNHPSLAHRVFELCEFIHDQLKPESLPWAKLRAKVSLHHSCHGLRGLGLGSCSECMTNQPFSKCAALLNLVEGLELVELERRDECCGFGGTFAVFEKELSNAMGLDRLADHLKAGSQVITSADMSCLMHLGGLLSRHHPGQARVMHIAEILCGEC